MSEITYTSDPVGNLKISTRVYINDKPQHRNRIRLDMTGQSKCFDLLQADNLDQALVEIDAIIELLNGTRNSLVRAAEDISNYAEPTTQQVEFNQYQEPGTPVATIGGPPVNAAATATGTTYRDLPPEARKKWDHREWAISMGKFPPGTPEAVRHGMIKPDNMDPVSRADMHRRIDEAEERLRRKQHETVGNVALGDVIGENLADATGQDK